MNQHFSHHYKILVLGETAVGKTCILMRYVEDTFFDSHLTTIGIDFKTKDIKKDNKKIRLQIWDTAGQDRYKTVTKQFYKGAQGIIIVYDITKRNTFGNVKNWIEQIDQNARPNVKKIIVGNKCDLEKERQITFEEGKALANEFNVEFLEVSASENINIENCFNNLVNQLLLVNDTNTNGLVVDLNKKNVNKGRCCGGKDKDKRSQSVKQY